MQQTFIGRLCAVGTALALCAGVAATAQAQTYPSKPIRLVVPYPAGGATDTLGRLLGTRLQEAFGQTVIVDNKPGAGGVIGNDAVAKAAPDGHTVLIGITALIQAPALGSKLPYDPLRDLIPVAQIASSADLFVVNPALPVNSMKEFVDHAKANPKKYSFGSYGNGTSSHIHGEMLNMQAGLDLTHVSYKGAAPLVNDLLGGQIPSAFVDFGSARAHLASGKFRILAITGAKRSKSLPNVPTFTELGYKAYEPYGWFGVFVPAGTPKDIVNKLSAEVVRILKLPEVTARIEDLGLRVDGIGAQEFTEIVKTDAPLWAKVIRDAQIKVD